MLIELAYVSRSVEVMPWPDLSRLLETAREFNLHSEITGMLIYHERSFLQLLEGEESAVEALFDRIRVDRRHQQVRTLYCRPLRKRNFHQWTMGFAYAGGQPKDPSGERLTLPPPSEWLNQPIRQFNPPLAHRLLSSYWTSG